jgi:hypothetical protein
MIAGLVEFMHPQEREKQNICKFARQINAPRGYRNAPFDNFHKEFSYDYDLNHAIIKKVRKALPHHPVIS